MYSIPNNLRTILATVVVLALGFFAYEYLFKTAASDVETTNSGSVMSQDAPGKEVFDLYNTVSAISLNGSVFGSTLFSNLTDFTTPLPVVSVRHSNPFSPLVRTTITSKSVSR